MPSFLFVVFIVIGLPVIGGAKDKCQENDCNGL